MAYNTIGTHAAQISCGCESQFFLRFGRTLDGQRPQIAIGSKWRLAKTMLSRVYRRRRFCRQASYSRQNGHGGICMHSNHTNWDVRRHSYKYLREI